MKSSVKRSLVDRDLETRFKENADLYSQLVSSHGIGIKGYADDSLSLFRALPLCDQERAISALDDSVSLITECSEPASIQNYNMRAAWNLVKRKNLVIRSDVFEKMGEHDIIEIWDTNGFQMFRSFQLLKYLSYTVEELLCYPFFHLFEREASIDTLCLSWVNRVLSGDINETVVPDVPQHVIRERFSSRRKASLVTPKYISPVKNRAGATIGFMYACTAQLLEN